jgi:pimeloyl-ACP methyl ester carboxylesterase
MRYPMNDVVVVLPGIMGSTLHKDGKPVWEPSTGGVIGNLRDRFKGLKSLKLPEAIGDDHPGDGVTAEALMPDIRLPLGLWTFDVGYTRLVAFLTETFELNPDPSKGPVNLLLHPYDWRLSNRYSGEQLRAASEAMLDQWRRQGGPFADAQLVFVCHSMGGLVARWYVDQLGGAEHTRALITLGTPHRGALNALDQLVNGVQKGVGPFKLTLTELARSLPSLHQLLPEYACIDQSGTLRKTTEIALPELDSGMVSDAMEFHTQIDTARRTSAGQYDLHPIGGYEQPTATTARLDGSHVVGVPTIEGKDERGDATVPRLSFTPPDLPPSTPGAHYAADNHGGLVGNQSVFNQIEGVLTASDVVHRGPERRLSVDVPEILDPGEPLVVRAELVQGDMPLEVVVADERGVALGAPERLVAADGTPQATPDLPGPGVYQVTVRGAGRTGPQVSPITTVVLAWPSEQELGPLPV